MTWVIFQLLLRTRKLKSCWLIRATAVFIVYLFVYHINCKGAVEVVDVIGCDEDDQGSFYVDTYQLTTVGTYYYDERNARV